MSNLKALAALDPSKRSDQQLNDIGQKGIIQVSSKSSFGVQPMSDVVLGKKRS